MHKAWMHAWGSLCNSYCIRNSTSCIKILLANIRIPVSKRLLNFFWLNLVSSWHVNKKIYKYARCFLLMHPCQRHPSRFGLFSCLRLYKPDLPPAFPSGLLPGTVSHSSLTINSWWHQLNVSGVCIWVLEQLPSTWTVMIRSDEWPL